MEQITPPVSETATKVPGPDADERQDLADRFRELDCDWELKNEREFMAQQIVFMRERATIPNGVERGRRVLYKRALCMVIQCDHESTRLQINHRGEARWIDGDDLKYVVPMWRCATCNPIDKAAEALAGIDARWKDEPAGA